MRIPLLLLFASSFVFGQESDTSVTYKRGYGPKIVGTCSEGGHYTYSATDTVLEWEHVYLNGVLDSATAWYGTGKLWSQTQYVLGIRHGKHVVFKENGEDVDYIQFYKKGILIREKNNKDD